MNVVAKEDMEAILVKMKFKYSKDKNLFYKEIVPSGSPQGAVVVLMARIKENDIEFWTKPKMQDEILNALGEVKAWRLFKAGKFDIKSWNVEEAVEVENEQGRKEYIELTPTPEELGMKKVKPIDKFETKEKEVTKGNDIEKLMQLVENDVVEFFGDSGTGKSKLMLYFAMQFAKNGRKVLFYDTEKNLTEKEIEMINKHGKYIYNPTLDGLWNFALNEVEQDKIDADVIILDSLGYPVLTRFARMKQHEKGRALLQMIAILAILKEWCFRDKKRIAIISNQPESEMGLEKGAVRNPFGDKAMYATKEIYELIKERSEPEITVVNVRAFRSRKFGYGRRVAQMKITTDGVNIEWFV